MTFNLSLPNLGSVVEHIDAMPHQMDSNLGDALQQAGYLIEGRAKQNAPVGLYRTKGGGTRVGGTLRRSIYSEMQKASGKMSEVVGTNVEYAPFVEQGTRYMRPRKFLERAVVQSLGEVEQIVRNAVTQGI